MSSRTRTVNNMDTSSDLHKLSMVELKAKLNQNNISYQKSDRKSKLIDLCVKNGLYTTRPDQGRINIDEDVSLQTLNKTVSELQQTVLSLTGNVQKLLQDKAPSTGDTTHVRNNNPLDSELSDPNSTLPTGGASCTTFGYAAESLPFVETVHPSLKKQIVEGKDVNLAALLIPFYSGQHSDPSTSFGTSKDFHDPRLNNSLTLAQFIQASLYIRILCAKHTRIGG